MLRESELNGTFITLNGFIQLTKNRYLYFFITFTVYILILCCNFTIVFLIMFKRSLHEPMYIFIAALLLNSVIFSTVIYPKLFIDLLSERQIISYSACSFQSFMFYVLGSSEFFLLAAMAFDRYVSICKPLQYPTIMRNRNITIILILAWIIPFLHLSVFKLIEHNITSALCSSTLMGIFCNSPFYHLLCVRSKVITVFTMILFLNLAFFPVFFILFTYTRIIKISYKSCREVRRKAVQTCLPHLLVLINYLFLCSSDAIVLLLDTEFSKTFSWIITLQNLMYQPLFNPIIYGLKMKEISKHLKKLLCRVKMS